MKHKNSEAAGNALENCVNLTIKFLNDDNEQRKKSLKSVK